jgi:hypothetical protein
MNINSTLLDNLWTRELYFHKYYKKDLLYNYGFEREDIQLFLRNTSSFSERQQYAIKLIEKNMENHGKEELIICLSELARVELDIQELEPWVRDHVVHAVLSFILGILINEKFFSIEQKVSELQWKIAGLFHDIAYPIQIAKDILKPFSTKINEIKKAGNISAPDIGFNVVPVGIENLTNGKESLTLIQKTIDDWGLDIDAKNEYLLTIKKHEVCHGQISALSVLYILDLFYAKFNPNRIYSDIYDNEKHVNWNQKYFENDIVPACTAIFLHNLPQRCFINKKIDRNIAPLAYLLRLSDCLQDWERPSKNEPTGFNASQYDIRINRKRIEFITNVSNERKNKIQNEIDSSLIAPDIDIKFM